MRHISLFQPCLASAAALGVKEPFNSRSAKSDLSVLWHGQKKGKSDLGMPNDNPRKRHKRRNSEQLQEQSLEQKAMLKSVLALIQQNTKATHCIMSFIANTH